MRSIGWAAGIALAVAVASGFCRADPVSDQTAAGLKEGAAIDGECLKKDVLKDVAACRVAATGVQRPAPVMLGLYFHMWFSDVVLALVYRQRNAAELSATFEKLADAEFPGVVEYERALHVEASQVCQILQVNCANAVSFHAQWQQRLDR